MHPHQHHHHYDDEDASNVIPRWSVAVSTNFFSMNDLEHISMLTSIQIPVL